MTQRQQQPHNRTIDTVSYSTSSSRPWSPPRGPSKSVPRSKPTRAALPTRELFDPWNTTSTGHQRAENCLAGSTSWRESRSLKLSAQFCAGNGGGRRVADTVGAGSEGFGRDGRLPNGGWAGGVLRLGEERQRSIWEFASARKGAKTAGDGKQAEKAEDGGIGDTLHPDEAPPSAQREVDADGAFDGFPQAMVFPRPGLRPSEQTPLDSDEPPHPPPRPIFAGLTVFINGSTAPTISDHKLKRLLSEHGANLSISLMRRSVTHVILGTPNGRLAKGAGGGLAAGKIQREVQRVGGRGVKYVNVEWAVQSLKAGRRLPEARYSGMEGVAGQGQRSVLEMFGSR